MIDQAAYSASRIGRKKLLSVFLKFCSNASIFSPSDLKPGVACVQINVETPFPSPIFNEGRGSVHRIASYTCPKYGPNARLKNRLFCSKFQQQNLPESVQPRDCLFSLGPTRVSTHLSRDRDQSTHSIDKG